MKEQPELGAPIIITLSKVDLAKSDGTKDTEWESSSEVPDHLKYFVTWQYCCSDNEEPKEDDAWQSPSELDLESMKMTITPPRDNLYKYLHVCSFVSDKWGEAQVSVKLKRAIMVEAIVGDIFAEPEQELKLKALLNVDNASDEELKALHWKVEYAERESGLKSEEPPNSAGQKEIMYQIIERPEGKSQTKVWAWMENIQNTPAILEIQHPSVLLNNQFCQNSEKEETDRGNSIATNGGGRPLR